MPSPRRRKGSPYNPGGKVHERIATDVVINNVVALVDVPDPFEQGETIKVLRSLRDDPFAQMHHEGRVDECQYWAGRAFQADFEAAERGPRAIDPSRIFVDGGAMPEPLTESQQRSAKRLGEVYRILGPSVSALIHDVLIHGRGMKETAARRGLSERAEVLVVSGMFVRGLDDLAKFYGLAGR